MTTRLSFHGVVATILIATSATAACAFDMPFEIGASLASVNFGVGHDNTTVVGIPSGGFGVLNPGVYASIFVSKRIAIEPQLGLILVNSSGQSAHVVNFSGQVDVFLKDADRNSPYLLGSAGLVHVSDSSTTPKSIGVGLGYRIRAGDRLSFRFDGRYAHYTDGGGNIVMFGVSIGGLFGKQ